MNSNHDQSDAKTPHSPHINRPARQHSGLWFGIAAGLATLAWMSAKPAKQRSRRRADVAQERRNPLHFFLAGGYPGRRDIDRSGERPLFERRQSVYDSY